MEISEHKEDKSIKDGDGVHSDVPTPTKDEVIDSNIYRLKETLGITGENDPDDFLDIFEAKFAQLELSPDQGQELARFYQSWCQQRMQDQHANAQRAHTARHQELKSRWGAQYPRKIAQVRSVIHRFADAQTAPEVEQAMTQPQILEFLAKLGAQLDEDQGITGAEHSIDYQSARAQIARLKKDPAFIRSYVDPSDANHQSSLERMTQLHAQASSSSSSSW